MNGQKGWINTLINNYYSFLKENTIINPSPRPDWTEISTPFIGLFNDTIDIFVKKQGNKILLSDDGNTVENLELLGVSPLKSQKRKEVLEQILANFGIKLRNKELITEATEKDFPQKKLNLISAILEISDLCFLAKHTVASVFREDVKKFLDEQKIIYTPHFISRGKSGLEFTFDFQIAYKNTEIIIKSFNSIKNTYLTHFLFAWNDIKEVREKQTQKKVVGLAVINDVDRTVNEEYIEALNKYGAEHILWSQRHKPENIQKLKEVA